MESLSIIILLLSFFTLLLVGVPVAYSVGVSTTITLLCSILTMPAITTVAQRMATAMDSFTLLAIPFFVLAGQLMNRGGIANRLIDFAKALVGWIPGGLAFVNIVSNMLFGSISGSAVASATAIGGIMGDRMKEEGYDEGFSAAVNITSATTGLIIPPSNVLIVYSLASGGASIAALFLAGYIPGLLLGVSLMLVAGYKAYKAGYKSSERVSFSESGRLFVRAIPSLLLLVIVIGGIVGGFFTATEASAIAVVYTFILSVVVYKEVKVKELKQVFLDTAVTTSIVLFLVATSMAMSWMLSFENIPQQVSAALLSLSDNKIVILLLINVILLVVGVFMDITPAILIFTPIFLPVVVAQGIDPVHFGIVMVMNLCVGLCTPPVGTLLFVGCSVADLPLSKVIKPILPFFMAMLVTLLLTTYWPAVSMWLPTVLGY
ncbi:MAG: TRAP transporter large permease [Cyclobacteriaceae bacterium]